MVRACLLSSVRHPGDVRMFHRMALSLQAYGFDVTVIAPDHAGEEHDGVNIEALRPVNARWKRPLLWWAILRKTLRASYDIYQIEDPELIPAGLLIKLLKRRPVVYDVMEHYPDFIKVKDYLPTWIRPLVSWAFDLVERWSCRWFDAIIASDEQIAQRFRSRARRLEVLFNYPLAAFLASASERVPGKRLRCAQSLIYAGGIMRDRGVWITLEAIRILVNDQPSIHLDLVGPFIERGLASQVAEFLEEHNLEAHVTVAGAVPFDQVGDYLARAEIGLIPFRAVDKFKKNIPGKLFEYMAYRLPIVASDLPPIRQFVEPAACGILVEPDNAERLAQAIKSLLENPEEMWLMGQNGWQSVNQMYSWELMEPLLISLYRDLVRQRAAS